MHLVPQLGELGFFGRQPARLRLRWNVQRAYGLMTQELERGDSGIRSFRVSAKPLVMYPIYAFGQRRQKIKWLRNCSREKRSVVRLD